MQGSSTTTSRPGHRTTTAFEQYVSGRRALLDGTAFFLESVAHAEAVLQIAEPADVIFAPSHTAQQEDPRMVGYLGGFRRPGDMIAVDGRLAVELQDYVATPFLSIGGPTVIRQRSAEGVAAFLSDADTARECGIFVDQLLDRHVLLDARALFVGADPARDALVRVHVSAAGEYRDGVDGFPLGRVGDERADIEASAAVGAGPGRAFARIVDPAMLAADLDDRPWIGRYAALLELLRRWDDAPRRPIVSGFGGHLVRALDHGAASPPSCLPRHPSSSPPTRGVLTGRPRERQTLPLDSGTARAAECLIATADESAASALLASELDTGVGSVAQMVHDVRDGFAAAGLDLVQRRRDAA
ncbi:MULTISPECIES: daptide biosynthesis RiPP recognition protein [unclassified Microbacterium]|uniref:daptide biosynthesis RiPP recognition protein n=1 Tax=unclassified Microbacterium TaxID=2609290 RepID=UPI001FCE3D3A|nr:MULTISPECIES: daptide biosynthesis RiPP recognition protein [unclassified Microbacterium]